MKKYIVSGLLFLLASPAFSQKRQVTILEMGPYFPVDSSSGIIAYKGVVEVPGVSAQDLFVRAKSYFFNKFNRADLVIQVEEPGKILGAKGVITGQMGKANLLSDGKWKMHTPIEIQFKDGRYRYEIKNVSMPIPGYSTAVSLESLVTGMGYRFSEANIQKMKSKEGVDPINNIFYSFLADLEKSMKTPAKEDW